MTKDSGDERSIENEKYFTTLDSSSEDRTTFLTLAIQQPIGKCILKGSLDHMSFND
jgi:hypothetical protein